MQVDAVFLYIHILNSASGLAIAEIIHSFNEHIPIAFITNCILFETTNQTLQLPIHIIQYIEINGHYCTIRTSDSKKEYTIRSSLSNLVSKLPATVFLQVHRSYIINVMYVRLVINNTITMSDGTRISLSRKYQSQFFELLRNYYI